MTIQLYLSMQNKVKVLSGALKERNNIKNKNKSNAKQLRIILYTQWLIKKYIRKNLFVSCWQKQMSLTAESLLGILFIFTAKCFHSLPSVSCIRELAEKGKTITAFSFSGVTYTAVFLLTVVQHLATNCLSGLEVRTLLDCMGDVYVKS